MAIQSLEDMFVYQLEEMYYVEDRLVEVLDEMAADATDDKLRTGFEDHREETRQHVRRVEDAFDSIGHEPGKRESKVLEALVEERHEFRDETTNEELRDLYDMQAGMKTERIEMTGYQGLITLAKRLDYEDATDYLEDNLSSERSAFYELQSLSQGSKLRSMLGQMMG